MTKQKPDDSLERMGELAQVIVRAVAQAHGDPLVPGSSSRESAGAKADIEVSLCELARELGDEAQGDRESRRTAKPVASPSRESRFDFTDMLHRMGKLL